jgi:sec-independent protein translocase protein TatB
VFNVGPLEFVVLAIVAVIVIGPERLPALARDAARMLRTLRELATGARTQLRDELGPEFADIDLSDLRNLNPRTALSRAILGDESEGVRADLRKLDPREDVRDALRGDSPSGPVSIQKPRERPLERGETAPYDQDAT